MAAYTLGFIFDQAFSRVLLIHKQRPDWQKGRLNGIGGKIEPEEQSLACMVRETQEETGLRTAAEEWMRVGEIKSDSYNVDVYARIHKGELDDASTITDEEIEWFDVKELPEIVLPNIPWLIPLAIDKVKNGAFTQFSVFYPWKYGYAI